MAKICSFFEICVTKDNFTFFSNYEDGMFSNDIALIKIRRKGDGAGIRFSDMVSPACLPAPDTPQDPGTDCVISGWGKINSKF